MARRWAHVTRSPPCPPNACSYIMANACWLYHGGTSLCCACALQDSYSLCLSVVTLPTRRLLVLCTSVSLHFPPATHKGCSDRCMYTVCLLVLPDSPDYAQVSSHSHRLPNNRDVHCLPAAFACARHVHVASQPQGPRRRWCTRQHAAAPTQRATARSCRCRSCTRSASAPRERLGVRLARSQHSLLV